MGKTKEVQMQVQNLKAYLANIGMTIHDFSVIVECNPRYLSRIINKHCLPGKRLAKDISLMTDGLIEFPINERKNKAKEKQTKQTTV